jgi:predicted glycosyltransferase
MSRKGTQQPLDSCGRECFNTVAALAVFATVFPEADTPFNFTGRTNTTPYNMPDTTPRLDILLYAHDGRGIGHVSRTIAIGIALRRLFPELRVLFLSGSRFSQELIGSAPLDWIKLPSYETVISNGKSTGTSGHSNFEDSELGRLRGEQIRQIVAIYRPRVVLADHSPQGKHRELIPALEARIQDGEAVRWVLGIRGVVGQVKQISSDLAASVFKKFYSSLLWYGDSKVLGKSHLKEIEAQFGCRPHECGYVSSLRERTVESNTFKKDPLLGTISIPWFGEKDRRFPELFTLCPKRV